MSLNGLLNRVQATPNAPKARPMLAGKLLGSAPAALTGTSNVLNLSAGAIQHIERIDDNSAEAELRLMELTGQLYAELSADTNTFDIDPQTGAVTLKDGSLTPRKDLIPKLVSRAQTLERFAAILNELRSTSGTASADLRNTLSAINVTI